MDQKQRIKWQLETFRQFEEQFFSAFKTPQEWLHQIFPGANHALWIIGHVSMVDNSVLSRLFPGKGVDKPDYSGKFGRQSTPSSNPADYPPPEELLAFFQERRATLLGCIENMTAEDFEQPVPPPKPPFIHNVWQMLSFMAIHESLHMGQLSMCRRALGNAPIV